jgi:hypothetical protein
MAKKSRSTSPYSKVMGRGVYPVIPVRSQFQAETDITPVYEEVNLDLQHEINEVFETWIDPTAYDGTVATGGCDVHVGLLDNVSSTIAIQTEAVFETAPELVYYDMASWKHHLGTNVGESLTKTSAYHCRKYDEPFTVARNLLWTIVGVQSTDFFTSAQLMCRAIIWGRKRRASESEFNDILYRERF